MQDPSDLQPSEASKLFCTALRFQEILMPFTLGIPNPNLQRLGADWPNAQPWKSQDRPTSGQGWHWRFWAGSDPRAALSLALAASNFDDQITQQWQKDTGRPKKNASSATETLHPMSFLKTTWTNMCMTQFHVQYLAFATAALHGPPCGIKTSPQQIDTFTHLAVLSTRYNIGKDWTAHFAYTSPSGSR